MKAIAAHFRYISKNGRLEIEDDMGVKTQGRESLGELADEREPARRILVSLLDEEARTFGLYFLQVVTFPQSTFDSLALP